MAESLRFIPLSYSHSDSRASALRLILALRPDWKQSQDSIEFVRFTDGITNTLLKAVCKLSGLSQQEADGDAILLRAYGSGTDVIIDRERETRAHALLASKGLAPPLFARFENGLLYKFIEGDPCSAADLRRPDISKAIAWRLAVVNGGHRTGLSNSIEHPPGDRGTDEAGSTVHGVAIPNIWTVLQKWLNVLPLRTEAERTRKEALQREYHWVVGEFGSATGVDGRPFVFSHCDLLSGNVIMQPPHAPSLKAVAAASTTTNGTASVQLNGSARGRPDEEALLPVNFIDYEYATPAPAAFDIANHLAEWAGFECEYDALPTRSQRRAFLAAYLRSYNHHIAASNGRSPSGGDSHTNNNVRHHGNGGGAQPNGHHARDHNRHPSESAGADAQLDYLLTEVDRFRGVPGFYWGVWALIQAQVSEIDFDYAGYADSRLGEYWGWKRVAVEGKRGPRGEIVGVRERRWAEE